jgi:hypothetical protein
MKGHCRTGEKCKYSHERAEEALNKRQKDENTDNESTKRQRIEKDVAKAAADESEDEPSSSVPSSSRGQREVWSKELQEKFAVPFGDDFFDLWDVARTLNPEDPLQAFRPSVGVDLVGAYDVLAGNFEDVTIDASKYHLHWRYYFDPPEVLTIFTADRASSGGSDGEHWGYFRDEPTELPSAVVSNNPREDQGLFKAVGPNAVAALLSVAMGKRKRQAKLSKSGSASAALDTAIKTLQSHCGTCCLFASLAVRASLAHCVCLSQPHVISRSTAKAAAARGSSGRRKSLLRQSQDWV